MAAHPLLARRREMAAVIVVCAAVVAGLGVHYSGQHHPGRLDTAIDTRVEHRLAGHEHFLHSLATFADPKSLTITCAVLTVILLLARRWRAAILAALGPALTVGLVEKVLKPLIGRKIGDVALTFPSGHTAAVTSVSIVLAVVLLGPCHPPWPRGARVTASAVVVFVAIVEAVALVGLGYHYATDTVGGFCVATGVVLVAAWAIDAVSELFVKSEHEPTRPPRTHQPV